MGTITSGVWNAGAITTTNVTASGTVDALYFTTSGGTFQSTSSSVNVFEGNATFGKSSTRTGQITLYSAAGSGSTIVKGQSVSSGSYTYTFPAGSDGTILTTANLTDITGTGTIASGTWQGSSITTAYTAAKYVGTYHSRADAPASPVEGDVWNDTDDDILYIYAGGGWRQVASW